MPGPVSPAPLAAAEPRRKAPAGAVDCHFHIFGPQDRYPIHPNSLYTPSPQADIKAYQAMADKLGIQRMVIVNPTPYGTDTRCTVESIGILGRDRARAVAVINDTVSDATLRDLDRQGFCAARINSLMTNSTPVSEMQSVVRRIAPLGWHLELYVLGEELPVLERILLSLPVPVVIDHMGRIPSTRGTSSPEFQTLLRLLSSGNCYVKLCGYRSSVQGPPYADLLEPAQKIIATAPERCVWGTDWPHPRREGPLFPNDGTLLDLLSDWAPNPADFRRILVDNPARLYRFA
jgi:predicted TIM-barrel fold metal-dependent hydrolase